MGDKNLDSELRGKVTEDLNSLIKEFIGNFKQPEKLRFYTGIVVDNNDAEKLGRCKIRVYGIYTEEILDNDLPWAIPDFNFIGSTLGSFIVPPIGAIVKIYFENDDIYLPRYTSKVIKRDLLGSDSFIAGKDEDYPNSMIFFETDAGEYFKINRTTNTSTYRHSSGLLIDIDYDGNLSITNEDTTTGNVSINISGNLDINVGGDVNITAEGKAKIKSVENTLEALNPINPLSAKNRLVSPGSQNWYPNQYPNDFFTGVGKGELGVPPIITLTGK